MPADGGLDGIGMQTEISFGVLQAYCNVTEKTTAGQMLAYCGGIGADGAAYTVGAAT